MRMRRMKTDELIVEKKNEWLELIDYLNGTLLLSEKELRWYSEGIRISMRRKA